MPTIGDKYVIEIDGPYYAEKGANRGPFWRAIGLNTFFTENQLKQLKKECHEEEEQRTDICIGDEVIEKDGRRFFVTFVSKNTLSDGKRIISGLDNNGYSVLTDTSEVLSTGRRNMWLASVVEDLKKQPKYSLWE